MIKKLFGHFWTEFNKKVWQERINLVLLWNLKTIIGFTVAKHENTNNNDIKTNMNEMVSISMYNTIQQCQIVWNINSITKTKFLLKNCLTNIHRQKIKKTQKSQN